MAPTRRSQKSELVSTKSPEALLRKPRTRSASVASSQGGDDDHGLSLPSHTLPSHPAVIDSGSQLVTSQMPKKARVTKQKAPKKTKAPRSAVFDANRTIALILCGDREVIY